jgi:hypothetical protein
MERLVEVNSDDNNDENCCSKMEINNLINKRHDIYISLSNK